MTNSGLQRFIKVRTISSLIISVLLISVLLGGGSAASEKEFIIGVEAVSYYPLYDFSAHDISKPSFTKELLSTFFELHHYPYQFVALPIKRFDKWYVEESIDFKFPDNFRWRNDKTNKLNITFSTSVVQLMAGSYVLKSKQHSSRNQIKKLGTILGFVPTLWFDKLENNQLEVIEETSPLSVIKHLVYGNVDATNIDPNVIRYNLKRLNKEGQVVLNKNIKHEVFAYHLSSIKYPKVIKEFDSFLQTNQDFVKRLKIKYGIDEHFTN